MLLGLVMKSGAETPQLAAAIAMTAATIVRGAQDGPVQEVFALLAQNERPQWQRSALMRGAESALLPAAVELAVEAEAEARAPVLQPKPARVAVRVRRRHSRVRRPNPEPRAGVTAMPLRSEPALVSVAREAGDLGQRATALLARLTWPGKPNAAPAAAPLTAEEQQRFAAGREVYQTLCVACHQPDGRGREQLAPPLVGSELALGPAGIAARIVLGGKEGPTGLMPPLGAVVDRRAGRRGADLHSPRVGPHRVGRQPDDGQGRPRAVDRPHAPVDGGGTARRMLNAES